MLKNFVIPGVVDEAPAQIRIRYDGRCELEFGAEVKPAEVIEPPTEVHWPTSSSSLYTLYMMDPDSKPVETNHWLVVNIPGDQIKQGDVVAPYSGPKPPPNTGLHRYVFTVYQQSERIPKLPPVDTFETRHDTTLEKFVQEFKLGKPIAANFVTAQPDEYSIHFWKDFNFGI